MKSITDLSYDSLIKIAEKLDISSFICLQRTCKFLYYTFNNSNESTSFIYRILLENKQNLGRLPIDVKQDFKALARSEKVSSLVHNRGQMDVTKMTGYLSSTCTTINQMIGNHIVMSLQGSGTIAMFNCVSKDSPKSASSPNPERTTESTTSNTQQPLSLKSLQPLVVSREAQITYISCQENLIAVGDSEGIIRIYETTFDPNATEPKASEEDQSTGKKVTSMFNQLGELRGLTFREFLNISRQLVNLEEDGKHKRSGSSSKSIRFSGPSPITYIRFDVEGNLVYGTSNGDLLSYKMDIGSNKNQSLSFKLRWISQLHTSRITVLAYDNKLVISGDALNHLFVYHAINGKVLFHLHLSPTSPLSPKKQSSAPQFDFGTDYGDQSVEIEWKAEEEGTGRVPLLDDTESKNDGLYSPLRSVVPQISDSPRASSILLDSYFKDPEKAGISCLQFDAERLVVGYQNGLVLLFNWNQLANFKPTEPSLTPCLGHIRGITSLQLMIPRLFYKTDSEFHKLLNTMSISTPLSSPTVLASSATREDGNSVSLSDSSVPVLDLLLQDHLYKVWLPHISGSQSTSPEELERNQIWPAFVNPPYYEDLILTGSDDKTIRLFNGTTGNCLFVFRGAHTAPIVAIQYYPNDEFARMVQKKNGPSPSSSSWRTTDLLTVINNHFWSMSKDGTVIKWDLESGSVLQVTLSLQASFLALMVLLRE